MRLRTLLTPVLSVALSGALLTAVSPLTALPEAAAVARHKTYSGADGDNLSKKEHAKLRRLDLMYSRTMTKKNGMTMDYRRMNKNDNGHFRWRRQVAAGFVIGGGLISHISKAERKKVYAEIPGPNQCQVCAPPAVIVPSQPDPGANGCQGRNDKTFYLKRNRISPNTWANANIYLNSCETETLRHEMNKDAIIFGIMAALCGIAVVAIGFAVLLAVVGGILALGAEEIDYRANRSKLSAVWFKVRYTAYIQLRSQ